jgi:hypothetical protein
MGICFLFGICSGRLLLFGFLLLTFCLVFQSAEVVGRSFSNAATAPSRQRCKQFF